MLGKHQSLKQMNWENIKGRFGQDKCELNTPVGRAEHVRDLNVQSRASDLGLRAFLYSRRAQNQRVDLGSVRLEGSRVDSVTVHVHQHELKGRFAIYVPRLGRVPACVEKKWHRYLPVLTSAVCLTTRFARV